MMGRGIYVASTGVLVLEIFAGGVMDLTHLPYVVKDVTSLGYPAYILYIIGVWKLLAVGALLWPRLPRPREWAYAGIFFEMSGAVASHVLAGDRPSKYGVAVCFTFLTLVSWRLRPDHEPQGTRQEAN